MTETCGVRPQLDDPRCGEPAPYVATFTCDAGCCSEDGHIALCDMHAAQVRSEVHSVGSTQCRHAGRPTEARLARITRTYTPEARSA